MQLCTEEHEARWGLLLCKYGVMYVESTDGKERLITCRRARTSALRSELDYQKVLTQASPDVRAAYEKDAAYIDRVQAEIRKLKGQIKPYDVFLCYKETAPEGGKTEDSAIAHDLYNDLTHSGYQVFFAPESLKEKTGANYEAAIFIAIENSVVMLVIGTRKEYFTSSWVRSEWKRFLERIDLGEEKLLLPLFRMADDLPDEFKNRFIQGYEMKGLYMRDVKSRLNEVLRKEDSRYTLALIFLQGGDFDNANHLLDELLREQPMNPSIWLGKAMAAERIRKQEEFLYVTHPLTGNFYFQQAMNFAPEALKNQLKGYVEAAEENIQKAIEAQKADENRRETVEKPHREAEAQARKEAAEKARKEAEEQARKEAAEKARREAEEQARKEAAEQARREAEEQARKEAAEKSRREAEEQARREAEEQAQKEAAEKARTEAEEQAQKEAAEKARKEAEELERKEAAEKAHREAEEKARKESEEQARKKAAERARREAEEQARKEATKKRKKKIRIVFSTVCVLVVCFVAIGWFFATRFSKIGLKYTKLSDSEIEITKYEGKVGDLVIPEVLDGYTIVSIGEKAFSQCASLTSVTIPDSVISIGNSAFYDCSDLTSVTIPDSVISIGKGAFSGCSGLTSVTIPDSVTSIGNFAFFYCSSLISITIPNSVTSISDSAFCGCSSLTNVAIPDSVTSIGNSAFYGCSSLTSVTIPNGVTSIGYSAFRGCHGLSSVTIPNSVTSIDNSAFYECNSSLIIYGKANSAAETYAKENNIPFVAQ